MNPQLRNCITIACIAICNYVMQTRCVSTAEWTVVGLLRCLLPMGLGTAYIAHGAGIIRLLPIGLGAACLHVCCP